MRPLDALFAPRRVAVLGASRNPAKLGHVLLKNLLGGGFAGEVFVVNPGGEPILDRPTLADPRELPEGLDLALVSLPPPAVPGAVAALAARRTRAAVILTSGFGEVDDRGRAAEAAVLEAARAQGLRLVGPNCMGVYSRPAGLNGTYFWDLPRLPGGISVVSQSGAYGGLIMRHLGGLGLGVARFLSIGNQVDLEIADALEYLAEDPETALAACFIEAVRDGRRFVAAARRLTAQKPLVVLKAGRTQAGRRAAGSHTGSLAGTAAAYQAAFAEAGIVACAETEEFFDAIQALTVARERPAAGSLAVLTVSGGPSVMAADAAEGAGLAVPAMPEAARAALRQVLPAFAAVGNPVDMTPQVDPRRIGEAAALVLAEPGIAGALAVNIGLDFPEFGEGIVGAAARAGKPLVACVVDAPGVARTLDEAGVPIFPTPERAARAYRALWRARQGPRPAAAPLPAPELGPTLREALEAATGALPYALGRELLERYGVRFCRDRTADGVEAALEAGRTLGYPVVVKTLRPDLLHKTEAGGVLAGIRGPEELRAACRSIVERLGAGPLLVQEEVAAGTELLVGGRQDETFGPVVVVGTGGVLAEALQDISLALAPLTREAARGLVGQGLRARLAAGHRGRPGFDADAVAPAVVALGRILSDHPRVREIDVNPLVARGEVAVAVDALVLVGDGDPGGGGGPVAGPR